MTMYLLDTNHLSPIVTLEHVLQDKILAQLDRGNSFAITAPVLNEFLFGILALPRLQQNAQIWRNYS